ncbi:MAG: hypothetical protein E7671_00610 [Ruminococcaceae bacterium]|nr:hypothetical protein [Oscillospiraceae bacterium]
MNDLKKLIKRTEARIAEVEALLDPASTNFSGMPRSPTSRNVTATEMAQLIDLKNELEAQKLEYVAKETEIEQFIHNIDDFHVKLIVAYHFIDMYTWRQTAQRIGGGNSEDSVRKACEHYLERYNRKHSSMSS